MSIKKQQGTDLEKALVFITYNKDRRSQLELLLRSCAETYRFQSVFLAGNHVALQPIVDTIADSTHLDLAPIWEPN